MDTSSIIIEDFDKIKWDGKGTKWIQGTVNNISLGQSRNFMKIVSDSDVISSFEVGN